LVAKNVFGLSHDWRSTKGAEKRISLASERIFIAPLAQVVGLLAHVEEATSRTKKHCILLSRIASTEKMDDIVANDENEAVSR
jgi:hypothetical protein